MRATMVALGISQREMLDIQHLDPYYVLYSS